MLAWAIPVGPICLSAAYRGPLGWTMPGLAPVRLPEAAVASAGGTGACARALDCGVRRCGAVRAAPAGWGWGSARLCSPPWSPVCPPSPPSWASALPLGSRGLQGGIPRTRQSPPSGASLYTRSLRGAALSQRGMWGGAAREGAPGLSRRPCGTHACGGWRITGVVRGLVGLACLCWRQGCPAVPRPVLPCRALQGGGSARGWAG